jgi:hypothetical protein
MSESNKTEMEQLADMLEKYYMFSPRVNEERELELRFGLGENSITQTQFNSVISKLKTSGFQLVNNEGEYMLRINPMTRGKSGYFNQSFVRVEINELNNIQNYCRTDYFDTVNIPDNISLIQKKLAISDRKADPNNPGRTINQYVRPVDFKNSNFRVNYKIERTLSTEDKIIHSVLREWPSSKKIYRYLKRYRFKIPNEPFEIHCSIVKTSRQRRSRGRSVYIEENNIQDSNIFDNPEQYEIEIEFQDKKLKDKIKENWDQTKETQQQTFNRYVMNVIKKYTKIILSGIQNTNYPIRYDEQTSVLKEYIKLTHREKVLTDAKNGKKRRGISLEELLRGESNYKRKNRMNFIGPSTISLEMKHIVPTDNKDAANINNLYTVTEKADGERHLMYINDIGKIYLLDINLNVKFTGCVVEHDDLYNTIFDGELVLFNKWGSFINHFLIFDLYISKKKDFRQYPFMSTGVIKHEMKYTNPDIDKNKFRFVQMRKLTYLLEQEVKNIVSGKPVPMIIKSKDFENNLQESIFLICNTMLDKIKTLDYETDGLIFTPVDKSVGSDSITLNHSTQRTWLYSFKWKPPIHNTVDFLVTTRKNGSKDYLGNIYEKGTNLGGNSNIRQYKQLELRVGYSQYKHGFLNPMDTLIRDTVHKLHNYREVSEYKPMLFYPTNPTPEYPIHLSNILLTKEGNKKFMKLEDGSETFESDMIVEFKFDQTKEQNWQWVPIKVRHDKTAAYKKGQRNFGNDYSVANSVWMSINNPITEEMIRTQKNVPDYIDDDTVYYSNNKKTTTTKGLRDFHNKYVKFKLINHMSRANQTLLDMTVGKAGDLPKWIQAKLKAVVGIDYSVDNIENQLDGACTRYLKEKQKKYAIPKCMFLSGNSSQNIKNGSAFGDKQRNALIMNALYGEGNKNPDDIGKAVADLYGIAEKGFDIISNQFSTHYFFKTKQTLLEFVKNLSENCKVGGYIIGTCYDGEKIFDILKDKQPNESVSQTNIDGKVIWKMTKKYDGNKLSYDETSLGLEIDIYQESINKVHTEFIVVFKYFTKILELYGFEPCPQEELGRIGLKHPIGSFSELFDLMNTDLIEGKFQKKNIGKAADMSDSEKFVSFLNNYYIYKKKKHVNIQTVENSLNHVADPITRQERDLESSILNESIKTYRDYAIKYKRKVELK